MCLTLKIWETTFNKIVLPIILNLTQNVAEEEGEESLLRGNIFGQPPLRDMDLNDGKSFERNEI